MALVVLAALGQEAPIMEFLAAVQYLAALHLRGAVVVQTQRVQLQVVEVLAQDRLEAQRPDLLGLETHQALAHLKETTAEVAEKLPLIMVQREAVALALLVQMRVVAVAATAAQEQHLVFLAVL